MKAAHPRGFASITKKFPCLISVVVIAHNGPVAKLQSSMYVLYMTSSFLLTHHPIRYRNPLFFLLLVPALDFRLQELCHHLLRGERQVLLHTLHFWQPRWTDGVCDWLNVTDGLHRLHRIRRIRANLLGLGVGFQVSRIYGSLGFEASILPAHSRNISALCCH